MLEDHILLFKPATGDLLSLISDTEEIKEKIYCLKCKQKEILEKGVKEIKCTKCGNHKILKAQEGLFSDEEIRKTVILSMEEKDDEFIYNLRHTVFSIKETQEEMEKRMDKVFDRNAREDNLFNIINYDFFGRNSSPRLLSFSLLLKDGHEQFAERIEKIEEYDLKLFISKQDVSWHVTYLDDEKNKDSSDYKEKEILALDKNYFEQIICKFDENYQYNNDEDQIKTLYKTLLFNKYPNLKIFGKTLEVNNSIDKVIKPEADLWKKDIDAAKYFIPKSTPKNVFLMKEAIRNNKKAAIRISNIILSSVQKPETLANLYKEISEKHHLVINLKTRIRASVLREVNELLHEKLLFGAVDESLNDIIKENKKQEKEYYLEKKLEELEMYIVDIVRMNQILKKRVLSFGVEKTNDELKVVEILEGKYKASSLKKLHDYLSELEILTNNDFVVFPETNWKQELDETIDGFKFENMKDSKQLSISGERLNNCISSYAEELEENVENAMCVVTKKDKYIFCMYLQKEDSGITILEAKKKNNAVLSEKDTVLKNVLRRYIQNKNLLFKTSDLDALKENVLKEVQ